MLRRIRTRISPATVLASIALFAALSGVSYAAGKIGTAQIKNGAVTGKKLHRNAVGTNKVRNGAVKTAKLGYGAVQTAKLGDGAVTTGKIDGDAVTGAKVAESTLGTVPDAATVGGKQPAALESHGFGGGDNGTANLPTSSETTVSTLSLPAGTYLVLARGGVNNNGGAVGGGAVECTVAAGGSSQKISIGALGANGLAGDREEFSAFVVASLAGPGDATLVCDTSGAWGSGNVTDPTLAAVSLQP